MKIGLYTDMVQEFLKMRWRQNQPRGKILKRQAKRLRKLRDFARENSSFYRRFHKGFEKSPLSDLPVLTKTDFMKNFDEFSTDPLISLKDLQSFLKRMDSQKKYLGKYMVNATSGTTGRQGIIVRDMTERRRYFLSSLRVFYQTTNNLLLRRIKLAKICRLTPWDPSLQASTFFKNRVFPSLVLGATEDINVLCQKLNEFDPDVISCYSAVLPKLLRAQEAGHLKIAPKAVISNTGLLTPRRRKEIEETWKVKPFDMYACTECGVMAMECQDHRGLHLNETEIIFENVDSGYRPVPRGEFGDRLLVTVLFSRTQPLIRYEIEDRIKLSKEPCSCGMSTLLIEEIMGRKDDVIRLSSKNGEKKEISPMVFFDVLDRFPTKGWQIIQKEKEITVLICGEREFIPSTEIIQQIRWKIQNQGVDLPPVVVQYVGEIPRTPGGKTPLFVSQIKPLQV